MMVSVKYGHGQIVYLRIDPDQKPKMITEIKLMPGGSVIYYVSGGYSDTPHYECELSPDKDVVLTTTN